MKGGASGFLKKAAIIAATVGLYHASPKLGYLHHATKQEVIDTLGAQEILIDQETNDIINLVSGRISQENMNHLLQKYSQEGDITSVDSLGAKNNALWHTMRDMQRKYGNPKVAFEGFFFNIVEGKNEPDRARYNPSTNKISLLQLDSVSLGLKNAAMYSSDRFIEHNAGLSEFHIERRKKNIIESRLAELAHAKQVTERGVFKMGVDGSWDMLKTGLRQRETYDRAGSLEHQAHSVYEPLLVQEFFATYKKHLNLENGADVFEFAKRVNSFGGGIGSSSTNTTEAFPGQNEYVYELIMQASEKNHALATYFLAEIQRDELQKHYFYRERTYDCDTISFFNHTYTLDEFKKSMFDTYTKSYEQGYVQAGIAQVQIGFFYTREERDIFCIPMAERILQEKKDILQKEDLSLLYQKLASSYWLIDESKARHYDHLSAALGYYNMGVDYY